MKDILLYNTKTRAKEIAELLGIRRFNENFQRPSEQPEETDHDESKSNKKQKTSKTKTVAPRTKLLYFFEKPEFYLELDDIAEQRQPKVFNPLEQLADLALKPRV